MAEQAPENSRSEDTPIDWIGQTIGHYRVEREIGRGGMGRVFYAIDTELERPVALKIIHPHLSEDETIIARFRQEAKSAARLSHPGIVHIYEFGREETGPPYFVMEYVEGVTLKDYLRKRRSLKVREALRVTLSIVKALEYAHKQNVVHRDIKPANILITSEGSIKILDFGLARFLEIEQTEGAILGSPHYMSPEQGQGKPTDHRSDMYSLGVTLYHMLMGTVPFRAKAPLAIVAKHVQSPIPEPESLKAILEGRLLDVLRRMLAKTPEERFPNYGELRKALQRLLHTHLSDTAKIEPAEKSESTSSDSDSDASDSGPSSKPSYGPMVLTGELFANETPQESQAQQTDPPPEEEDNSYSTPDPWASDTSNWQLEADSSLSLAPEEKPLTRRKSWILGIAFFVLLAVGMVVFGFIAMMPGGKSGSYSGITPGQNGGVVTPGPTPAPPAMTTETIDTAMGVDDPTTPTLTLLPERLPASQTEAWLDTKKHLVQNIASGTGAYLGSSPKNIASALMAMDYDSVRVEVQEIYHKIDGLPDSPERTLIYERLGQIEQVADTLESVLQNAQQQINEREEPVRIIHPGHDETLQISEMAYSGVVIQYGWRRLAVTWNDLFPSVPLSLAAVACGPEPSQEQKEDLRYLSSVYGLKLAQVIKWVEEPELQIRAFLPPATPTPTPDPENEIPEELQIRKADEDLYWRLLDNIQRYSGPNAKRIAPYLAASVVHVDFQQARQIIREEIKAKSSRAGDPEIMRYMHALHIMFQNFEDLEERKRQMIVFLNNRRRPVTVSANRGRRILRIDGANKRGVQIMNAQGDERTMIWQQMGPALFADLVMTCFPGILQKEKETTLPFLGEEKTEKTNGLKFLYDILQDQSESQDDENE